LFSSKQLESGYGTGSENSLKRHGSTVSLQSNTYSTASGSSFKRSSRNLREKLAELETFKDILCRQIETLQEYFDYCVDNEAQTAPNKGSTPSENKRVLHRNNRLKFSEKLPVIDFKGEAITFKTTAPTWWHKEKSHGVIDWTGKSTEENEGKILRKATSRKYRRRELCIQVQI
jgi:collagen type IV alpha-3-binding protein